ncbi:MAG: leucine-rich repeat domain-containing protein, partial [Clostridiales bacterium]|nr:leucine-rich repeat domain-containing protein [Clostridiales bacterium]
MRKRGSQLLSLALTASIVVSTAFMGIDVSAAELDDEVVQQKVMETLPEKNAKKEATLENVEENTPAAIISVEELQQKRSREEENQKHVEESMTEETVNETIEVEESLTSYLAADSDLVADIIDNEALLNALIEKVKPDATASDFTYRDLRAYDKELDLGNVNFTSIPKEAFSKCSFTSITLPDNITSIGENAFDACQKLEHINSFKDDKVLMDTLPSGLERVEQHTFQQCISLNKITIPSLKNGDALAPATAMFYGCTGLCDVTFGDNVAFIPSDAFERCGTKGSGMKIHFGTGLVKIMDKAFIGTRQTGTIDLSKCTKLTEIGAAAFKEVDNLNTVKLPDNTASLVIGAEAFACPTEYATFLTTMGAGDTPEAGKIILPEYVTELGAGCFYGNTSITDVHIPSSVPYIGEYTFDGCTNLGNITFTNNKSEVKSIGDCAFRGTLTDASFLQYLTKLEVIGTQHIEESVEKENNDIQVSNRGKKIGSLALGGQNAVVDDYGQKKNNSKDKLTCGSEVFTNCVNIKNIILPASLKEVGSRAFYFSNDSEDANSVSNIETITWLSDENSPAKRVIYSEAFRGNKKMTEMILPADNQSLEIHAYAFCEDETLTKLTESEKNILPKSLQCIGWGAFYDCLSLEEVSIQNKTDGGSPVLGAKAFEGCHSLSKVGLPSSLTEIPLRCFAECNLTAFPSGLINLETIGELSFYGNPFVTLDLSELVNLTKINGSAFAYYDLLAEQDREDKKYNVTIERAEEDTQKPTLTTVILPDKTDYKGEALFLQSGMFAGQSFMTTMKPSSSDVNGKIYIPDYMIQSGYGIFAYTGVSEVIWEADTTGIHQWITIPLQMYQGCQNIERAETVLPKGSYVENIGLGLFSCSSVRSADLSGYTSLKVLGQGTIAGTKSPTAGVFGVCMNLTDVILPEEASFTIGEYSFAALPTINDITTAALTNISLGGATEIGANAFLNQSVLSEISMPDSVVEVKEKAFSQCTGLINVAFPGENNLKTIGNEVFWGCKSLVLTDSRLLEGAETIGNKAFYECNSLGTATFGANLTSIGDNSFAMPQWAENTGVTKVDFSKAVNLQKIGNSAFEKSSLTDVEILGTKVTAINTKTFYDCQCLKTIAFGKDIEYIGNDALAGCGNLSRVEVAPTTTISKDVFKSQGTNKEKGYTAQVEKHLSIVISTPSAIDVPLGYEMDLPFYTTVNETSKSSYAYVVMKSSDSSDEEALKVSACLTDGCYKDNTDANNKIEVGDFYESLQRPYTIKIKRAGTEKPNIETIKLMGLKATTKPITLTLKGSLSFETADKDGYRVDVADYGVSYQVSVNDKPILSVLYTDSEKTTAVPDGEGITVPMNISGNKYSTVYFKLEDTSGAGETLDDVSNIVVETNNAAVLYPASSSSDTVPEDNKYLAKVTGGSGSFTLIAASVGTATITVYPEGYERYAHVYTYKVDSYISSVKLAVPAEYSNKANAVGTEFNVFESYTNYMNQTVNKENMEKFSEYSGFSGEIRYESADPDYVSVDDKGNVKILKAGAREKRVRIKAYFPRSLNENGVVNGNASVDIRIAGSGVDVEPILPVLYSDSTKTTAVPDGEGVKVPMNISESKATTLYYKLEDMSGLGEVLDTNNIVVETSDASVLYPAASESEKAPEDNKYLVKGSNGSGQFNLVAASVGTATITVYPEGYPQYKHIYTYKVDSFIQAMKVSIPTEFNKANAVGTEFNIFDFYTNYFNQTVKKENMDKYSEYSGFTGEIRYTSDAPDYVSVDNKGNVKILKADTKEKSVQIKVEYPIGISSSSYSMKNITINVRIAGSNTTGGNTTGGNTSGGNTTGGNTTGGSSAVVVGKEMKDTTSGATVLPTVAGKKDLEGEVKYVAPASSVATTVVIPDTVTLNGVKYKVTSVD